MFATQFVLDRFDCSSVTHLDGWEKNRNYSLHILRYYISHSTHIYPYSIAVYSILMFRCSKARHLFPFTLYVWACTCVWVQMRILYIVFGVVLLLWFIRVIHFKWSKAYLTFKPIAFIWMCYMIFFKISSWSTFPRIFVIMFLFLRNIACIRKNSEGIRIKINEIDAVLCMQNFFFIIIIRNYYIIICDIIILFDIIQHFLWHLLLKNLFGEFDIFFLSYRWLVNFLFKYNFGNWLFIQLWNVYSSFLVSIGVDERFCAQFLTTFWQYHWVPYATNRSGPKMIDCNKVKKNPPHGDIPEQIMVISQLSKPDIEMKLPLWK